MCTHAGKSDSSVCTHAGKSDSSVWRYYTHTCAHSSDVYVTRMYLYLYEYGHTTAS